MHVATNLAANNIVFLFIFTSLSWFDYYIDVDASTLAKFDHHAKWHSFGIGHVLLCRGPADFLLSRKLDLTPVQIHDDLCHGVWWFWLFHVNFDL